MRSAPVGRWREYAGLAAEVSAAVVIGLLIMILVLMLNPSLQDAATGPVPDSARGFFDPSNPARF